MYSFVMFAKSVCTGDDNNDYLQLPASRSSICRHTLLPYVTLLHRLVALPCCTHVRLLRIMASARMWSCWASGKIWACLQ